MHIIFIFFDINKCLRVQSVCIQKYEKIARIYIPFKTLPCLLDRNTQLNKYLRTSHCKTHENCWIINVEKLTSVLSDFQMKKVSHFFILNCTKNPSFLFIWIFSSKKRWKVKQETIIITFSLSIIFEVFCWKS